MIKVTSQSEKSLVIEGELSFSTARHAVNQVSQALNDKGSWTIDLSNVAHADSAGMAFVCEIERYAKCHDIKLAWVNVPEQMYNIAQVSGLEPLFKSAAL